MTDEEARRRYQNDSNFRRLVDVMVYMLTEQQTNAYEIRDAATYAVTVFLSRHPNPVAVFPEEGRRGGPLLEPSEGSSIRSGATGQPWPDPFGCRNARTRADRGEPW